MKKYAFRVIVSIFSDAELMLGLGHGTWYTQIFVEWIRIENVFRIMFQMIIYSF